MDEANCIFFKTTGENCENLIIDIVHILTDIITLNQTSAAKSSQGFVHVKTAASNTTVQKS